MLGESDGNCHMADRARPDGMRQDWREGPGEAYDQNVQRTSITQSVFSRGQSWEDRRGSPGRPLTEGAPGILSHGNTRMGACRTGALCWQKKSWAKLRMLVAHIERERADGLLHVCLGAGGHPRGEKPFPGQHPTLEAQALGTISVSCGGTCQASY